MEWIVVGLTGLLLFAGVATGSQSLARWLRARRARERYRRGLDEIPIVFRNDARTPSGRRTATPSIFQRFDLEDLGAPPEEQLPAMDLAVPLASEPDSPPLDLDTPPDWRQRGSAAAFDPATASEWEAAIDGARVPDERNRAHTMRLLPGRLEVEEGGEGQSEIRFVDSPGTPVEVTFGRRSGEPFRHVQLRSPTVSREHARMIREGGEWAVENLSATNPIVVNGWSLPEGERLTLKDGDRLEMGEVVFRYRCP